MVYIDGENDDPIEFTARIVHTMNEIDGCVEIMYVQFSAALARSVNPRPPRVEICPVCHQLPDEHTEADLTSCMAKWRKQERGGTLEIHAEFIQAQFKNEEPDPVKRAQFLAQFRQRLCSW
jgi:hypothetical protein